MHECDLHRHPSTWVLCLSLGLLVVAGLLSTCVPQETDLTFGTIEQEVGTMLGVHRYEDREPRLVVVASADEILSLSPSISPEARPELANTDFSTHFVVAVFQGAKRTWDYEASIERVSHVGATVRVFAEFVEPSEGQMLHPSESSPYHVVSVEKPQQLAGKDVRFVLIANGQEITSEMHWLP